jgi:hypothetical protein
VVLLGGDLAWCCESVQGGAYWHGCWLSWQAGQLAGMQHAQVQNS